MVDRASVRRPLSVLQDALADLRRYRARFDAAALMADRDAQHIVLHALYVAAQAAIDLALHAAADAEQPTTATYQQAFDRLAAAGRIDRALVTRLMGWAGLRNVLAHHYVDLDYARIAATLHGELGDLESEGRTQSKACSKPWKPLVCWAWWPRHSCPSREDRSTGPRCHGARPPEHRHAWAKTARYHGWSPRPELRSRAG